MERVARTQVRGNYLQTGELGVYTGARWYSSFVKVNMENLHGRLFHESAIIYLLALHLTHTGLYSHTHTHTHTLTLHK